MGIWSGHSPDVLLTTIAQILPVFLLAMAADLIATRFVVNRPARWMQRLLYLNIGYLMVSEFLIVSSLASPLGHRVAPWLPLGQLALALTFSYGILLLRWQGHLAHEEKKAAGKPAKNKRRGSRL